MKIFQAGLFLPLISIVCANSVIHGAASTTNYLPSTLQLRKTAIGSTNLYARSSLSEKQPYGILHQRRAVPPRQALQPRSNRRPRPRNRAQVAAPQSQLQEEPPETAQQVAARRTAARRAAARRAQPQTLWNRRSMAVAASGAAIGAAGSIVQRVATTTDWQNPADALASGAVLACVGALAMTAGCLGRSMYNELGHSG